MDIPLDALDKGTLRAVIEEFVTRDGTEFSDLEEKVHAVRSQLERGEARIVFDEESKTCNICSSQK